MGSYLFIILDIISFFLCLKIVLVKMGLVYDLYLRKGR